MPSLDLPLADGPHLDVFEAIVARLKGWSDLRRVVRVWRVWDGDPNDAAPWSIGMCPGLRLTPSFGEVGNLDPAQIQSELAVGIEIATAGTNLRNPSKIWRAIKLCLSDPTWRYSLTAKGAYPHLIDFGPLRPGVEKDSPGLVISRGVFSITCIETTSM